MQTRKGVNSSLRESAALPGVNARTAKKPRTKYSVKWMMKLMTATIWIPRKRMFCSIWAKAEGVCSRGSGMAEMRKISAIQASRVRRRSARSFISGLIKFRKPVEVFIHPAPFGRRKSPVQMKTLCKIKRVD